MVPTRYVIIGGSAAGLSAAQSIREVDPLGRIEVLSAESDAPYFRPLIPFLIDGRKTESDLLLLGQGPYTAPGIEVRLNARAKAVDVSNRKVVLDNSDYVPYDKLLVASGSRPSIPASIEGTDAPGVFGLRTIDHARAIAQRAKVTKEVVLAGGGMLNLKTAFALLERGLVVTMVVASPEVLSQIMDPDAAGLIRNALERAGLRIITDRSVARILSGANGVKGVVLNSGEELPCQMVCIGKGVEPNVEFLDGSGIEVNGGVLVDEYTATNVPDVYAAGDVAATFDSISGRRITTALWTNAVEMGRCAGRNMAGRRNAYAGTFGILNATQVANVAFVSMGIVHSAGSNYESYVSRTADTYRKVVFSTEGDVTRLVGVILVGDISQAGLYRQIIRERLSVSGLKDHIIAHRLHYGHFLRE